MKRLTLPEWAAIADIVGTVAVVVSLLFLAHTIEQNTAVTQSANDNFLMSWTIDSTRMWPWPRTWQPFC